MSISAAENPIETQAVVEPAVAPRAHSSDRGWVWQVTTLSVGLGVMLALAIGTTRQIKAAGVPGNRLGVSAAILSNYERQNTLLQKEIKDLRGQVGEFERSVRDGTQSTELLKKQLQDVKALSGLAAVKGPGVKITLKDSQETRIPGLPAAEYESYNVHDQDINGLLNELKAAGAEALAIAGADNQNVQRVTVTTTARCVGPNAVVNGTRLGAPYTILAIGSPKELRSALEMPDGFIQMRGLDVLKMISIEETEHLVLPEYSGNFSPRYARPTAPNP